jgi:hypothetical protein
MMPTPQHVNLKRNKKKGGFGKELVEQNMDCRCNEIVGKIFDAYKLVGDEKTKALLEVKKKMSDRDVLNVAEYLIKKYLDDVSDIERSKILVVLSNFFELGAEFIFDVSDKIRHDGCLTNEDRRFIINRFRNKEVRT